MSHSKYGPSSASRWLACNPSIGLQGKSTKYAAEGSVAHQLADDCRTFGFDPSSFIGEIHEHEGFQIEVTEEMADCVAMYLDVIDSFEAIYGKAMLEQRIIHSELPEFGGTVDCSIANEQIVVIDFKYGAGVFVDVTENKQLGCYALLLLDMLKRPIQDVIAVVVQPRCFAGSEAVRETTLTKEWLQGLFDDIRQATFEPSDTKVAGSHCQFCPIKATCSLVSSMALSVAKQDFKDVLAAVELDDDLALVKSVLEKAGLIQSYLKAVYAWAHNHLAKGGELEGYKLVETVSNRRYTMSDSEVIKACSRKGFGKRKITKQVLLSPAQLEKVVGKKFTNTLCSRTVTGATMVPASDKRPAVRRLTVAEDFADVTDIED